MALTWRYDSGETVLFYDSEAQVPFWRSEGSKTDMRDPEKGGVSSVMAARTARGATGAFRLCPQVTGTGIYTLPNQISVYDKVGHEQAVHHMRLASEPASLARLHLLHH